MNDSEILNQMLQDRVCVKSEKNEYNKNIARLTELKTDSFVYITNVPGDAIIMKSEEFSESAKFFKGKHGECKRADYVIISEEKNVIIYIELSDRGKKNQKSSEEIIQQLTGSICFIEYCRAVAKNFWKENSFLKGYESRFVHIRRMSAKKRKTVDKRVTHDKPENLLTIDSPNKNIIPFRMLTGKI